MFIRDSDLRMMVQNHAVKITPDELIDNTNPLETIQKIQEAVAKETGKDMPRPFDKESSPFEIAGNMPPEFRQAIQEKRVQASPVKKQQPTEFEPFEAPPERTAKAMPDAKVNARGTDEFETLLEKLTAYRLWEPFQWPSKGKFYSNIPDSVNVRAMTGEEEQILSTARFVKKGTAIDMIFKNCIKEAIPTEKLLSADRNHLLIFLRGISYTPEYDVEIKCPNCTMKFPTVIDLNDLDVNLCPDDFSDKNLSGTLPISGFKYRYRLATGQDEMEISDYQQRRIEQWGDQSEDDTALYRTALLLEEIESVTMKKELALLMKKLPS